MTEIVAQNILLKTSKQGIDSIIDSCNELERSVYL